MFNKSVITVLFNIIIYCSRHAYAAAKSSLVFVIDDTYSMTEEIEQVKDRTLEVFDAVYSSNGSMIDDFVLVTFNDPGTRLRIVTRDKYEFKREVEKLHVTLPNGDCAELTMAGIERGLENSKPNSFFYVFTDASAKDHEKFERVKSLSLKKSIQVTFLLTGLCGFNTDKDYVVFEKLAEATSGQVFNVQKEDISEIINYIIETIKHKKTSLAEKIIRDNDAPKKITFTVDSKIWDVMIAVSGVTPNFHVLGPDNTKVPLETIAKTQKISTVKLVTHPGVYTVILNESTGQRTSVVVTGSTTVTFDHGFSTFQPSSINATSTNPIPDQPSFLSIKLDNDKRDVFLKTVELRDENDNVKKELPLKLINKEQQFYTTEAFIPPNVAFKIAIHGYTQSLENITRVSPTTIEYQKPNLIVAKTKNMAPTVTILEGAAVNADYNKPLTFHCKVLGYPKSDISWRDATGALIASTVKAVDLPYEYMSILQLDTVKENGTLTCEAKNSIGQNKASINIQIKNYFYVLEYPTNTTIEYETSGHLTLKIDAFPRANIVWYKNDEIISNDSDLVISGDNSSLTVNAMHPEIGGSYSVEVFNGLVSKRFNFNIFISGLEPPKINKSSTDYHVVKGSSVDLSCRTTNGRPEPEYFWAFDDNYSYTFQEIATTEIHNDNYHIDNIEVNDTGVYKCTARNVVGEDVHTVNVFVDYPPFIQIDDDHKLVMQGDLVELPCLVDGMPIPSVHWFVNGLEISQTKKYKIYKDNTLSFRSSVHDIGKYTCEASNPLGKDHKDIVLDVFEPPKINKSSTDYHVVKGSSVDLSCRVTNGRPEPEYFWAFDENYSDTFQDIATTEIHNDSYHIDNVDVKDTGVYKCTASNVVGEDVHTVNVFVDYPPFIQIDFDHKLVMQGELVQLPCLVDGMPIPSVHWFVNGLEISQTKKYKIYKDNTLSFRSSVHDIGKYTCEASNPLGKDHKDIVLDVFVPVNIESPKLSILELKVGSPLLLPCRADGFPRPDIKWTLFSRDPKVAPRPLRKDINNSAIVKQLQLTDEGWYMCVASNAKSTASITYEVHVNALPAIVNTLPNKTIEGVIGDQVLRIPCEVTGVPKPTVTWMFSDGSNVLGGRAGYSKYMDENGTLIIKNLDEGSANTYICLAQNPWGVAKEKYAVVVLSSPTIESANRTIPVEQGVSYAIDCGVSHKNGDLIHWFKDGKFIMNGELVINDPDTIDSGTYSCRVSNFENSKTYHTRVEVGRKPIFVSDEETDIHMNEDTVIALSCEATGEPQPNMYDILLSIKTRRLDTDKGLSESLGSTNLLKTDFYKPTTPVGITVYGVVPTGLLNQAQWWKGDQFIKEGDDMLHILLMTPDDVGQYMCIVYNDFGSVRRTFNVHKTQECVINTENDFMLKKPLPLITNDLLTLRTSGGTINIKTSQTLHLYCPNSFINIKGIYYGNQIKAICVANSIFNINGNNVDYADISCNDKIVPLTKATGIHCGRYNTELLKIGYNAGPDFVGVYDVCLDKRQKLPLYTKHEMYPTAEDVVPDDELDFLESEYLPFQFDDMYNCYYQRYYVWYLTGKILSANSKCCFAKRQLVNPRDVLKGYQQVATYNYLNVIPKWGTCGTENWDELEERVRALVRLLDYPLLVYTGTSHPMKLPGQIYQNSVRLIDKMKKKQPVPQYIWKVIIDNYKSTGVAIIQINTPEISIHQLKPLVLCRNICHEIEWMRDADWADVTKGFTYCCHVKEFEKAFSLRNVFSAHEFSPKVLI